jgi:hypothetical protein
MSANFLRRTEPNGTITLFNVAHISKVMFTGEEMHVIGFFGTGSNPIANERIHGDEAREAYQVLEALANPGG